MVSLCGESISDYKVRANSLVNLSTVLCIVFIVPIVFYTFYKSIYDFGPKHRKRSFIDASIFYLFRSQSIKAEVYKLDFLSLIMF